MHIKHTQLNINGKIVTVVSRIGHLVLAVDNEGNHEIYFIVVRKKEVIK